MPSLRACDDAVAGAVGAVLLLAVLVTGYTIVLQNDLPRYGALAENEWEADIAASMGSLAQGLADGATGRTPVSARFASPPVPQSIDIPLLGSVAPVSPSGSVSFNPSCTRFSALHTTGVESPTDLRNQSRGCLTFRPSPVYGDSASYVLELGGVLRVQGDRAVVVQGPAMEFNRTSLTTARVSLTLVSLQGASSTLSNSATEVRAELNPIGASLERAEGLNAASANWTLHTDHPLAWKNWFQALFDRAQWPAADYAVKCLPAPDCSRPATGQASVEVTFRGPRSGASDLDLQVSISHVLYTVDLR